MPVSPPAAIAPTPSASEQAAARRRAAAAARRRQAARAARAERAERAREAAQRRRAARLAAAKRAAASQRRLTSGPAAATPTSSEASTPNAAPFLLAGLFGAIFLLGLALTPAHAVPWSRASRALDDRREEIAVLGGMGLFATALLFFFVTIVAR